MPLELKIPLNVVPWVTPNYVSIQTPPRRRQDGFQEGPKLPLAEVDAEVLAAMCDAFRAEVFVKAQKPDPKKGARP
jgi:hypothetical protein